MEKSEECQPTFVVKEKKGKKEKKCPNCRIVGGNPAKKPMPWMVLINIKGSQCGGTLINNEFVLTAAHCFCSSDMMCDRMTAEVEENKINKIRVSVSPLLFVNLLLLAWIAIHYAPH